MRHILTTALAGAREQCAQDQGKPPALPGMGRVAEQPYFRPVHRRDIERALRYLRKDLGHSRSDHDVLAALLSFLPCPLSDRGQERPISPEMLLTIYASNNTICDRAGGISDRTLRRAITRLEERGWIARRASSNGKRFPQRSGGQPVAAFGIDITPLMVRSQDLIDRARHKAEVEEEKRGLLSEAKALRSACINLLDGRTLPTWINDLANIFRRTLSLSEIQSIIAALKAKLSNLTNPKQQPISEIAHGQFSKSDDGFMTTNDHHEATGALRPLPCSAPAQRPNLEECTQNESQAPAMPTSNEQDVHRGQLGHSQPKRSAQPKHKTAKMSATDGQNVRHTETQKTDLKNRQPDASVGLSEMWETCSELQAFYPEPLRGTHHGRQIIFGVSKMLRISERLIETVITTSGLSHCLSMLNELVGRISTVDCPDAYFRSMIGTMAR